MGIGRDRHFGVPASDFRTPEDLGLAPHGDTCAAADSRNQAWAVPITALIGWFGPFRPLNNSHLYHRQSPMDVSRIDAARDALGPVAVSG